MLISKAAAGRLLGISKQAMGERVLKNPNASYFIKNDKGKIVIDDQNPEWIRLVAEKQAVGNIDAIKNKEFVTHRAKAVKAIKEKVDTPEKPNEQKTTMQKKRETLAEKYKDEKKNLPATIPPPPENAELRELVQQSAIAQNKKQIYQSRISAEKAKQEEMKTLQIKKELAPFDLIKHFFSFSENMIQRIYRRPHEISVQVKNLYLAGEDMKATQLMIRELESIVKDSQQELMQAIKDEGYKYKRGEVKKEGGK